MEKIIALCKEKNVDLLFLKTPNDHIDNQVYYRLNKENKRMSSL